MKEELKKIVDNEFTFIHVFDPDCCGKKINHLILEEKINIGKRTFEFANSISRETHNIIPCIQTEKQKYSDEEYKSLMDEAILLTRLMGLDHDLLEMIENAFNDSLEEETIQEHIAKQVGEFIKYNYSANILCQTKKRRCINPLP